MSVRTFVTGGARSGKSRFAERLALELGGESVLYVATAEAPEDDAEMWQRIEDHRRGRPAGWDTFEISYGPSGASLPDAARTAGGSRALLVDSLTLWISGRMYAGSDEEVLGELDVFLSDASGLGPPVVVVSDEVGLGLVPESPEGRRFRDLLGLANQRVAAAAEEVYLCVSGVPLRLR
ncbi:bifunctional adenosylcobinamide kinase/adenosylcobinamide-phosphate guanylyltransferase [Rubrobacter aplysinae]|uniref:bifunctional adenosylcobinamide kinase/adenosylcobinamide-phosphate guanylyltransferase n=1 Tax=Rubrobacter aplysinae TaxID=909625 RepID=UPI00064BB025|nr:bifunctional adenosylcobinamide kinase/adenosylcobinamide-phosphate guanylyltransferase [Rubrobacter aplysinae]